MEESLKKMRKCSRTAFTSALNEYNNLGETEATDIDYVSAFAMLSKRYEELDDVRRRILNIMFSDDHTSDKEIDKEQKDSDAYERKFMVAQTIESARLASKRVNQAASRVSPSPTPSSQHDISNAYKMPKIELFKYDGSIKNWLRFWSLFKKIHEDPHLEKEHKFNFLTQSVIEGSRAEMAINRYPPTAENYDQVIESLKNRFGREDIQIEVYVRELITLIINKKSELSLNQYYSQLDSLIRTLESFKVITNECAIFILPLVESSLPTELLRIWQRSDVCPIGESNEENKAVEWHKRLKRLLKFIDGEVNNELKIPLAKEGFDINNSQEKSASGKKGKVVEVKDLPTAHALMNTKQKVYSCIFDGSTEHKSEKCPKAGKMSLQDRQEAIKQKRGCFRCLRLGHNSRNCHARGIKCEKCNKQSHVGLMCFGPSSNSNNRNNERPAAPQRDEHVAEGVNAASINRHHEVFLRTLKVTLYSEHQAIVVRAAIDTGATQSYISKKAAKLLKYVPVEEFRMNHLLFGGSQTSGKNHALYKIFVKNPQSGYTCTFDALDEEVICKRVPTVTYGAWCNELKHLNVTISDFCSTEEEVELLIGSDIAGKLNTGKIHQLKCGLTAEETLLGWTLSGKVSKNSDESMTLAAISLFVDNDRIQDLWELDVLGIKDPIAHKAQLTEEKEAMDALTNTIIKDADGRYEVAMPFLDNHPPLGDNKGVAIQRLKSTAEKLKKEGLYEIYDTIFKDWEQEKIIERLQEDQASIWGHYVPHRAVVKLNSTTPVRPVFDASAKEKPFPALNECLQKGPNLIEMITAVLLRFRLGKLGIIADIKKAFLQIGISANDRDFLRFLWYDEKGNTFVYRHRRLVFGLRCSPFILGAVIIYHLTNILSEKRNNVNKYRNFSEECICKLIESFYVDNCVTSVNTTEEMHEFISQAKDVMTSASFDLRGWEYTGDQSPNSRATVLGITWDKNSDTLSINVPESEKMMNEKITKRVLLSVTNKVFDPFGFTCPVTLIPRLYLKEICANKLRWDDEIDESLQEKLIKWVDELSDLKDLKIPRCMLGDVSKNDKISLHTFCDASKYAYAAVVFLRIESNNNVNLSFVQAKAKVAPGKWDANPRNSIPRLELLAAAIGARLTQSILKDLKWKEVNVFYWSDSSTVIAWIHRFNNWGTFVYNRVKEIRELSKPHQWRHVPGQMNPADLPSRGCSVGQLMSSRWWEGPVWLRSEADSWPNNLNSELDEVEINKGLKKTSDKNAITLFFTDNEKAEHILERYEHFVKLVVTVAWIKRFFNNCQKARENRKNKLSNIDNQIRKNFLTLQEIINSKSNIYKMIQTERFDGLEDQSISHLEPFKDEAGVIRLKSKIALRDDTYDFRFPIVLPKKHPVVSLIVMEFHIDKKHAGTKLIWGDLREQFWILGGRRTLESILNKCTSCKRDNSKALSAVPAPLPINRVRDAAVFEIVGVDLTGPVYLKGGVKAWICIFTCAVFRAVHLDLVLSLNARSFLMALERFIKRRGRPSVIYSDNGTNFRGLNTMMSKLNLEKIMKDSTLKEIEWKFNPPSAAWWGGFWERLIGILKKLLRRTLKKASLDYVEMYTVLTDCEAVINARPITFISEKDHTFLPLSPSNFLQEIKEAGVIDLDTIHKNNFKKRYMYQVKIKEDLRYRFRREYLGALMHNSKKGKNKDKISLKIGDVVLIGNDNTKRIQWPLACIKEIIRGKDGNERVIRLATANGELVRPIQRIFPLEVRSDEVCVDNLTEKYVKQQGESMKIVVDKECESIGENENALQPNVTTRSGRKVVKPLRLMYN